MLNKSKDIPLTMCFIAGALIIAISLAMDYALKFATVDPLGLGAAWQFGPRELVHLTGLLGAVLVSYPILQVLINIKTNKLIYFCASLYFLLVMVMHRYLVYGESEFRYLLWGGAYVAFLTVMLTMSLIRGRSPNTSCLLLLSACFIEIFNLWWELVQQPHLGFRGNAPRGSVQPAQIICDFLGVSAGLFFSCLILKASTQWWRVNHDEIKASPN
jgi:hypothetical protein